MLVAGLATRIPYDPTFDYVGIDHGAVSCMRQGIPLLCAIGDFDSISHIEKKELSRYTRLEHLPAHKNETDSEVGILYAMEHNYDEIILYGGIGGRMDHTLANMYLAMHRDIPLVLEDEFHYCKVLKEGVHEIPKRFTYLSFLALEDTCISEEGVAYPLDHQHITIQDIFPISNEIIKPTATITIHEGKVLMIQCMDQPN